MAKGIKNKAVKPANNKVMRRISTKLISGIIPVVAIALVVLLAGIAITGRGVINELLTASMQKEAEADAKIIENELTETFGYLDGIADSLENIRFANNMAITNYLKVTLGHNDMIPTGVYIGVSDNSYIDPSGWDPGPDYIPTEKNWYKDAMASTEPGFIHYDVPYFDSDTGNLCDTIIKHVKFRDGRDAVVCSDLMLNGLKETLNNIKIFETGKGMLVTSQGLVLSYENAEAEGSSIADLPDDVLLQSIGAKLTSQDGTLTTLDGPAGKYYAVFQKVANTDWYFVAYAPTKDVLKDIIFLVVFVLIFSVIGIALTTIVVNTVVGRLVRKPVGELTENINKISEGDFTVDINDKGNDEIAYMNKSMKTFVTNMRSTLQNMQNVAEELSEQVESSMAASETLNDEASAQSNSMDQIKSTVENMAQAVNDVAVNATELAETFADLVDEEETAQNTMRTLVEKAHAEQQDMSGVRDSMSTIAQSMDDMNQAVQGVDEAAHRINEIIDMINSIASQTNLLSLNASIEAARAGEAGKGFAVVATEIGQLANNSADATTQIADIIKEMTAKVQDLSKKSEANNKMISESSTAVETAANSFQEIYEELSETNRVMEAMAKKMDKVNDVATNMASVAEEQGASTEEISATIENLAESSRKVANGSQEVANTSETVEGASNDILKAVKEFHI